MKTLLVYSAPRSGAGDEWMDFLPIGLGYLQAALKSQGFPCCLANLSGKSNREILAYFREQGAGLIGVSMFTFNRKRSFELLKLAREACPGALLLAGGPHPTHLAAEVFEECPALDAIVKGEGEGPLLGIVHRRKSGEDWRRTPGLILRGGETPSQPPLQSLELIPAEHFEADFLRDPQQLAYLSTSRGCPARCTFCNTPEYWGSGIRFRSPVSVVREMELLQAEHGLTYFSFRDDTFTAQRKRTMELMGLIQGSDLHPFWNCQSRVNLVDEERLVAMKRAGCEFLQFGVEHGSERVLKSLDKGTSMQKVRESMALVRRVGMNLGIFLITGIPGETWEDVEQSGALIRETRPHDVQISPLAVYPGTRLFAQYRAEGRISRDFFRAAGDAEVFARVDAHTEKALQHLDQVAQKTRPKAAYRPADFAQQKKWLGYCAVTQVLCGEAAEGAGRFQEAEAEYSEIIRREPGSTWGFLKRALLRQSLGQSRGAREDVREVLRLVPRHPEAHALALELGLD
ncbi:B12-binding domain-containing radical SAM protein [Holophaga foetida]|uniref:B12-binding domain-containing radical SAM protein n=1 Tax=Holophaga foetida TaxID=35839 RepID=UPI0002472A7B|nr:B12-binding domain-containing radical SAM protein [Holophaga foetida]